MIASRSLAIVFASLVGGASLVAGCSDDDPTSPSPGASSSSGAGTSSGGEGAGDQDAGGQDAGNLPGETKKALGEACATKSDTSAECESGVCAEYGGGGNSPKSLKCSIKCDGVDSICMGDPPLGGKCNGKGYCNLTQ